MTLLNMTDEFLACFDANGKDVESHPRSEALAQPFPEYYHAVVNVWVVDRECRILCSQRSSLVSANANKWQTYFGGHVPAKHTFVSTLLKEVKEEIGLDIVESDVYLLEQGRYEPHKHFYQSYGLLFDPENHHINFHDGEVAETKWMALDEYNTDRVENPTLWCNGIGLEVQQKLKDWIQSLL